ncbi:MAG: peptide deformylase [Defluviitaleaceae bacterium]|nr:peptide deformylase [Defluviitaleaceae bacterium]
MAIRTIRKEGDEILSKKSKPVKEINDSIFTLLDDMLETMRAQDGVGLAAPQVGALKRVVVIEHEEDLYELINPEIIETEGNQVCNEACLSAPGRCGDIDRPFKITVQALNRHGETVTHTVDDFMASVFCHEIDHLDGVMFLEKATNIQVITEQQMRRRKRERKERHERRKRAANRI